MDVDGSTKQASDFREIARILVEAADAAGQSPGFASLAPGAPELASLRLEELPKELGVLLASVGVLGFILPGVAGTPALIAGGLVLWPKTFGKVDGWLSRRYPATHRKSMQQVGRFLDDLDRRYPRTDEMAS